MVICVTLVKLHVLHISIVFNSKSHQDLQVSLTDGSVTVAKSQSIKRIATNDIHRLEVYSSNPLREDNETYGNKTDHR